MTPEQKKRAENLLALRHANRGTDLARYQQGVIALLQELVTDQPEARTPIQELMAQYAAEGCDFTDIQWARGAAKRLANTMPDSQARCILFALAEQPASVPVLTVECEPGYWSGGHYHEGTKPYIAPTKIWELPIGTKLYTAPAARDQSEQNLEMARDAERYRYLRNDCAGFDIAVAEIDDDGHESWVHGYPPDELDAAIDAAIKAQKGGEQ